MIDRLTVLQGDWVEQLRTLPDASAQMCVTSPPYWGLRDYGVAGQLGLEKTPEEYVAKLVEGFREVRRVLRDDGTLWLNLGDSYFGDSPARKASSEAFSKTWNPSDSAGNGGTRRSAARSGSLKPKDLVGIPWRCAFALQADGWYLRSDIIWHKRNPMPESVTDRPTKAHEYIFLLSKNQTYFYDNEAVKEQSIDPESLRPEGRNPRGDDKYAKAFLDEKRNGFARTREGFAKLEGVCYPTRNRRTVWTVPSQPYPESHFATFPEDLIKPCILAGTSAKGCCPKCGAGWERVVEKSGGTTGKSWHDHSNDMEDGNSRIDFGSLASAGKEPYKVETLGWQPGCDCVARESFLNPTEPLLKPVPATVLDPFGGSGTTGQVALELGRKAILIELNPEYVQLIERRTNVTPGLPLA